MQFLDLTLPTPEENLALDEALLLNAESEGRAEYLRVWESPTYFVCLGKNCRVADDAWVDNCHADGVPILRRISGGGTVLLGPGCLNIALILSFSRSHELCSVPASFDYVLSRFLSCVQEFEPRAARAGLSDLAIDGRKFSGHAQRRQRTHFLHQCSFLCRFNLSLIGRYLREPKRRPAYRADRDHSLFVTNSSADSAELRSRLRSCWGDLPPRQDWARRLTADLAEQRYGQDAWTHRR